MGKKKCTAPESAVHSKVHKNLKKIESILTENGSPVERQPTGCVEDGRRTKNTPAGSPPAVDPLDGFPNRD